MSEQKRITMFSILNQPVSYAEKADALRSNGFDVPEGIGRLAKQERDAGSIKAKAAPPVEMGAAAAAPARGTMVLQPNFVVMPGGTRKRDGAHWRNAGPLSVMVEQARQRHEAKGREDEDFTAPFSPSQIAVSEDYRALVERIEAGLCKGSSLEAGRSGSGGSGLAIDTYIQEARWLAELRCRIGQGVTMQVRRHLDRDNARRAIPVRVLVDMVLVQGKTLSDVLRAYGWAKKTDHLRIVRGELCAALDRMCGYRDA
ncbi:hypothetical protein Pan4_53 [Pseudanabaena phage Pan4]|nr:hypothetical protein Pan4_53 [Pseudanabaena phage Pan4]